MAANHNSNGPVTDVTSEDIRCYQQTHGGGGSTSTFNAKAGGTVSWAASPNIFHPGALSAYMAKVPAGMTAATFDGSGARLVQDLPGDAGDVGVRHDLGVTECVVKPRRGNGVGVWTKANMNDDCRQGQRRLPNPLVHRGWRVSLPDRACRSPSDRKPQFYISCAQLSVSGGSGAKKPTGLVAFPGAYKLSDPGLAVNIYAAKQYTPAGPSVFSCLVRCTK